MAHKIGSWVQTGRDAHMRLAQLIAVRPNAAAIMHYLISETDKMNFVRKDQNTIAENLGLHRNTVSANITYLAKNNWLRKRRMKNISCIVYEINSFVSWCSDAGSLHRHKFYSHIDPIQNKNNAK